jgi:hypothetical protein
MATLYHGEYVPSQTPYATILASFILIMCIAFTWQAMNAINLYAEIRYNGNTVEGRWTSSYPAPMTGEEVATYAFEVDGITYRGSQPNPLAPTPIEQGAPIDIVYSIEDPDLSRVAGTEGYSVQNVIEIVISVIMSILAVQFLFAYHTQRSAWIFMISSQFQYRR